MHLRVLVSPIKLEGTTVLYICECRYGDPLDPFADLEGMAYLRDTLLVPGGLLFLAVPTGRDHVVFNLHRIYGYDVVPVSHRHVSRDLSCAASLSESESLSLLKFFLDASLCTLLLLPKCVSRLLALVCVYTRYTGVSRNVHSNY